MALQLRSGARLRRYDSTRVLLMRGQGILFGAALVLLVAGCGAPAGDAERGRRLFSGELAFGRGDAMLCNTCHAVEADAGLGIGPNLAGVATRAGSRVPGQSAEEYLRSSLLDPDAYLAEGYQEGIMYRGYAEALTPQEQSDLIAYLLTLR